MFTINIRSNVPIFEQIYQAIAKYIALGILGPDEQLPTVRALARDLGINPNTVSKAYQEAERAGLIYGVSGVGMFVSNTNDGINNVITKAYQEFHSVYKQLLDLGESKADILNWIKEQPL